MKSRNALGAALGCVLVLAGVAVIIHDRAPRIHDDPRWVPVQGQPSTDPPPSPLFPVPDPIQIDAVARYAHTRAGGEKFAFLVAQLSSDTRRASPRPPALARVLSAHMPGSVRDFLLTYARAQRRLGTERHYDTSLDMWIRSEAIGPPAAPDRVNVEVAASSVSLPLDVQSWRRDRYDVVWESGRWQLISYSGGVIGPDSAANLTAAEQKSFLTGPGWRRIPAGSG